METIQEYDNYKASHSNHKNSKIRSIVSRQNIQYDSLGGSSFSNTKVPMTTIIQDKDFLVYDNLKLTGRFKLNKSATLVDPVYFNGNAFSLIDSLQIYVGGQVDVNITQYFQHIVTHLAKLKLSQTEYSQYELTTLAGKDINSQNIWDFELPLGILGLAKKFLPTADLMKIEIKIQFQKDLARVFNSSAAAGQVTGYELENVHITSDTITYDANVAERTMNAFRSAGGVQIPSHSYSASSHNFLQGTKTHSFTPSATYTNLVNVWCVPTLQDVIAEANGCSATDYVENKTYLNKDYPEDFLIRLGNSGNPANQYGAVGCSNKMGFYNGVLKTVSSGESRDNVAWKLTQQYDTNDYQVVSGSWLRAMTNSPSILNSGVNTYPANGQLSIKFKTANYQAPSASTEKRALLVINEFTSVLKIAQGQVMLME